MVLEEKSRCMSREEMNSLMEVLDLFYPPHGTYLRVFGCKKPSHLLLRHATKKLVMQEVSYHLVIGLYVVLQRRKKESWPTFPLQVGFYEIENLKVVDVEAQELESIKFSMISFH